MTTIRRRTALALLGSGASLALPALADAALQATGAVTFAHGVPLWWAWEMYRDRELRIYPGHSSGYRPH